MHCMNDFASAIRSDLFLMLHKAIAYTPKRQDYSSACVFGNPEVVRWRGGDVYLYAFFLSSSLCLHLPNRIRSTVTSLAQRQHLRPDISFQKWHHCAFLFCCIFNQSKPDSQVFHCNQTLHSLTIYIYISC